MKRNRKLNRLKNYDYSNHEIARHNNFQWQKSFYDHIIRDEQDLNHIREYIMNNSFKWEEDVENKN